MSATRNWVVLWMSGLVVSFAANAFGQDDDLFNDSVTPRFGMSYDVRGVGDLVINRTFGTYVSALESGALNEGLGTGAGVSLGGRSLFSEYSYIYYGCDFTNYATERVNINTPSQNFRLQGDAQTYGGELGFGLFLLEAPFGQNPDARITFCLEGILGFGWFDVDLQQSPFNVNDPIIVGQDNPSGSETYFSNELRALVGIQRPGLRVAVFGGLMRLETDAVTGRRQDNTGWTAGLEVEMSRWRTNMGYE